MKDIKFVNFNIHNANDVELIEKLNAVAKHEYPTSHRKPHNLAKHILLLELNRRMTELGIKVPITQSA